MTLVPRDFRPRCMKCGEKWLPPEGCDATVMPCPSCRLNVPPELSIVSATGADLERLMELVKPRVLREKARDMSATAEIIERNRQWLDQGLELVTSYMTSLRKRWTWEWRGVPLCPVTGQSCLAGDTGRCAYACLRKPNVTHRTIRG
jgi:hypothetical protein